MGGYSPKARAGLIALLASRRIMAEKVRREEAKKKERRSGWFR